MNLLVLKNATSIPKLEITSAWIHNYKIFHIREEEAEIDQSSIEFLSNVEIPIISDNK